jgi:iron complex outermembrane receptor protein
MLKNSLRLSASALALILAGGATAAAQTVAVDEQLEAVVITSDRAGLLERVPSDTVNGIDKSLLETPRSASFASSLQLQRYGIETVDELVAASPGAFTASFYGVPGSVNLRGTLAEIYFRGFKRIENRGTYPTPLGATEQVEIVRGPPTAYQGAGKVGGFLNFVPKTARVEGRFLDKPTGEIKATAGTYNKKNLAAQVGLPANFGAVEGGVYLYGELEDSGSFYKGIKPKHQLLEVSSDFNLSNGLSLAVGGMFYHSDGYVQTPGWNRVTQDLIDNQTYITGRDTTVVDTNGDGRLQPSEQGGSFVTGYFGFAPPNGGPRYTLDTGVGTAKLSPRRIFLSSRDFSKTQTHTLYTDLVKTFDNGSKLKLQGFYDRLLNKRFVSYGFPGDYDSRVLEARLSYNFDWATSDNSIVTRSVAGASYRRLRASKRESSNSGFIALDRRDIAFGPTSGDVFDDPFSPDGGLGWDSDNASYTRSQALFALTDITFYGRLNLVLGGRYDDYYVEARDPGVAAAAAYRGRTVGDGDGSGTWSASVSYALPYGFRPYFTYAESAALEVGQAGDIAPALVVAKTWLSDSDLREVGLKFQLLNGTLVGALDGYRQTRTQFNSLSNTVVGHRAKGVELELRWLANKNLSFTFNGNRQKSTVKGPDNSFVYVSPQQVGVTGPNGYGGGFAVFAFSTFAKGKADYEYTLIPRYVVSLFGNYTTDEMSFGTLGGTLGVTAAGKTSGVAPGAAVYPAYATVNGSLFYAKGPWQVTVNIDNLFDKLYFKPITDTYANVATLPGTGREARISIQRRF